MVFTTRDKFSGCCGCSLRFFRLIEGVINSTLNHAAVLLSRLCMEVNPLTGLRIIYEISKCQVQVMTHTESKIDTEDGSPEAGGCSVRRWCAGISF